MESMLTVRQVAELLGVHENWVYDQAASGELPSYKLGGARRFDPDEVAAGSPSTARPSASSPRSEEATRRRFRGGAEAAKPREGRQPTLFE